MFCADVIDEDLTMAEDGSGKIKLKPPIVNVLYRIEECKWGSQGVIWRAEDITDRGVEYYKRLLDNGWHVNQRNSEGFTALHYAGRYYNYNIILPMSLIYKYRRFLVIYDIIISKLSHLILQYMKGTSKQLNIW